MLSVVGARIEGKYELKRLMGRGAMGAVYEGVHLEIGKRIAVKLIHPHVGQVGQLGQVGQSLESVARFRREARAASAIESDHVVQIFDFGRDPALGLYMVIEYFEGEDLAARLLRERWIAESDAVAIAVQIGRGLVKAHAARVVHRDLKPANVFIVRDEDGWSHVKLLDFGISKISASHEGAVEGDTELTKQGVSLGTPQYMSPEQVSGAPANASFDVWAMAVVLYEMLAGETPVRAAGGPIDIMHAISQGRISPLLKRATWVSPELSVVVDAALARDPAVRITDAATFVARLLEVHPHADTPPLMATPAHPTDVTELAPPEGSSLWTKRTDPDVHPVAVGASLASESRSKSSAPPPSSSGGRPSDAVTFFERGVNLPRDLSGSSDKDKSR